MPNLPIPELTAKEIDRFSRRVDKTGDCWLWTGFRDKDGYGGVKIRQVTYRASRIAYRIHTGNDPGEMEVCHHCDNPPCVRGDHFFLGTNKDNQRDKWAKGRQNEAFNLPENKARGSRVNTSKLSEDQVKKIIERLKKGEGLTAIGNLYGITKQSVSAIKLGTNWKHLPR